MFETMVDLPMPPSANVYWKTWRGRAVKSPEARAYQATLARLFATRLPRTGPVAVRLDVWLCRGDLDNRIKVVLDALKGVLFVDDKQVHSLEAHRYRANSKTERVVVRVADWQQQPPMVENDGCGVLRPALGGLRLNLSLATPNVRKPR